MNALESKEEGGGCLQDLVGGVCVCVWKACWNVKHHSHLNNNNIFYYVYEAD